MATVQTIAPTLEENSIQTLQSVEKALDSPKLIGVADIQALVTKLEGADSSPPTHEQLTKVVENATWEERAHILSSYVDYEMRVVEGDGEHVGKYRDISVKSSKFEYLQDGVVSESLFTPEASGPQIIVKPVYKYEDRRSVRQKLLDKTQGKSADEIQASMTRIETDEVLVIVRANNASPEVAQRYKDALAEKEALEADVANAVQELLGRSQVSGEELNDAYIQLRDAREAAITELEAKKDTLTAEEYKAERAKIAEDFKVGIWGIRYDFGINNYAPYTNNRYIANRPLTDEEHDIGRDDYFVKYEELRDDYFARLDEIDARLEEARAAYESSNTIVSLVAKVEPYTTSQLYRQPGSTRPDARDMRKLLTDSATGNFIGVVHVQSEAQFLASIAQESNLEGKFNRGEITIEEYKKSYQRRNKESLTKHWTKRTDEVQEKRANLHPSEQKMQEMQREHLVNVLEGRYVAANDRMRTRIERISQDTEAFVRSCTEKGDALLGASVEESVNTYGYLSEKHIEAIISGLPDEIRSQDDEKLKLWLHKLELDYIQAVKNAEAGINPEIDAIKGKILFRECITAIEANPAATQLINSHLSRLEVFRNDQTPKISLIQQLQAQFPDMNPDMIRRYVEARIESKRRAVASGARAGSTQNGTNGNAGGTGGRQNGNGNGPRSNGGNRRPNNQRRVRQTTP